MELSATQRAMLTRLRSSGSSRLGVGLDTSRLSYLLAAIARDLDCEDLFPLPGLEIADLYEEPNSDKLRIPGIDFGTFYMRILEVHPNADTYLYCLGALLKARLKYERILQAQPLPTIEQVGPRGLLQFGQLSPRSLASLLFWRKWIYDIDNRAAQETGYLFEPIVAHAIGGVPYSSRQSPIRRDGDGSGRQVDCVREEDERKEAYELKLRVTIAASGQGRWGEELSFPRDCTASGYTPILVVFDATPNPKLEELQKVFLASGGAVYVGDEAWLHLEDEAGPQMGRFLEKYVRRPIDALLREAPDNELPGVTFKFVNGDLIISIEGETLHVARTEPVEDESGDTDPVLPEDVEGHIPSP